MTDTNTTITLATTESLASRVGEILQMMAEHKTCMDTAYYDGPGHYVRLLVRLGLAQCSSTSCGSLRVSITPAGRKALRHGRGGV